MKVAKFIRNVEGGTGVMKLYNVEPPMVGDIYNDETDQYELKEFPFVVVSATVVPHSGPEAYIFPADGNGEILGWTEMDGSIRGTLDHAEALKKAGYSESD